MSDKDIFKTIESESTGLFKNKGSKFLSFAYPVTVETEIDEKITNLKKEFHDARHHCYAYLLGPNKEKHRMNDDGEPSGTAGRPIFGQINSKEVTNTLVVVVRYFGGTLLGTGGLVSAYKSAARDALDNARIITKTVDLRASVFFEYEDMNNVMRILTDEHINLLQQDFQISCSIDFSVRKSWMPSIIKRLNQLKTASCKMYDDKKNIN